MRTRMRPAYRLIAVALLAILTACSQPPTVADVRRDVENAVAKDLPPGLLTVEDVTIAAASGRGAERAIQYDAVLRLNRAHAFGAWDQFNGAALAASLGSRTADITGLNSTMNGAGDLLRLRGQLLYRKDDAGTWGLRGFVAAPDPAVREPNIAAEAWRLAAAVFDTPNGWSLVRTNLTRALARSRGDLARSAGGFALAGGPPGSDPWRLIEALRIGEAPRRTIVNVGAEGPDDVLRLIRDAAATAVILDSDRADAAASAVPTLRALGALYPQPVHVLVSSDSKATSVAELRGKRIAFDMTGGPAVDDVLRAHRVPPSARAAVPPRTRTESLAALQAGQLDAVVLAARLPAPEVTAAFRAGNLRLLPLDADAIALLTTGENRYRALTIPGRTYRDQLNPVATVAVVALLVTTMAVDTTEVTSLLLTVFGPVDYLRLGADSGMLINPANAHLNLPLALHPAAATFFRPAR